MKSDAEKYEARNKILFYSAIITGLFVGTFGTIGGLYLLTKNFPIYEGWAITLTSIGLIIFISFFVYNMPDFKPRTIKKLRIKNKSKKNIENILIKWFEENNFDIRKENLNNIIGHKIINEDVKFIFKISLKENKKHCNLTGEFYVFFDYDSKFFKRWEMSINNKRIAIGSHYKRPAWYLMEDLIKNLQ